MKIRINDLARELEVKSKAILDVLDEVGVTEKKTHSSSLEDYEAERVRKHFSAKSLPVVKEKAGQPEVKPKIDLSKISKPGDVLKLLKERELQQQHPAAPPKPVAAPPASVRPPVPVTTAKPATPAPPAAEKPAIIVPKPVVPEKTAVVTPPAAKPAAPVVTAPPPPPPAAEKPAAPQPPAVVVTPPTAAPPAAKVPASPPAPPIPV